MKQFLPFVIAAFLVSCNDSEKNTGPASAPVTPGIENVNGNIPDTTNSISLDNSDTTSRRDSLPR